MAMTSPTDKSKAHNNDSSRIGPYGAGVGLVVGLLLTLLICVFANGRQNGTRLTSGDSVSGAGSALTPSTVEGTQSAEDAAADEMVRPKAYVFGRIAEVHLTTGDPEAAIVAIKKIPDAEERDRVLLRLVNMSRDNPIFDPGEKSAEDAKNEDPARQKKRLSDFEVTNSLIDLIENKALKAVFLARQAELEYNLKGHFPPDSEPKYDDLMNEANSVATKIVEEPEAAGWSFFGHLGIIGVITTALTTVGGFLASSFLAAALSEAGKHAAKVTMQKTSETERPQLAEPVSPEQKDQGN